MMIRCALSSSAASASVLYHHHPWHRLMGLIVIIIAFNQLMDLIVIMAINLS
jgi:hypothetical protein